MKVGSLCSVHQNFKILAGKQAKRGIFKEGKKNRERQRRHLLCGNKVTLLQALCRQRQATNSKLILFFYRLRCLSAVWSRKVWKTMIFP